MVEVLALSRSALVSCKQIAVEDAGLYRLSRALQASAESGKFCTNHVLHFLSLKTVSLWSVMNRALSDVGLFGRPKCMISVQP